MIEKYLIEKTFKSIENYNFYHKFSFANITYKPQMEIFYLIYNTQIDINYLSLIIINKSILK